MLACVRLPSCSHDVRIQHLSYRLGPRGSYQSISCRHIRLQPHMDLSCRAGTHPNTAACAAANACTDGPANSAEAHAEALAKARPAARARLPCCSGERWSVPLPYSRVVAQELVHGARCFVLGAVLLHFQWHPCSSTQTASSAGTRGQSCTFCLILRICQGTHRRRVILRCEWQVGAQARV